MKKKNKKKQKGRVIIIGMIFFVIIIIFSAALVQFVSTHIKAERLNVVRAQALQIAEAGMDKAAYELNHDLSYDGEEDTALGNGSFTIEVSSIDARHKQVTSTGTVTSNGKTSSRVINAMVGIDDTTISFRYGVQAGDGGFTMANSSTITGNVFSSGPIVGSGDNYIYGDVVSTGASGWVYGVHSTGNVFSHTIGKTGTPTTVDKDAYYVTKTNTTVTGTSHPDSPDQSAAPMPITDDQISEWESDAEAGGTISTCDASGNYEVSADSSLGSKKINCNLIIKNITLTITGPIWVSGNITIRTNAHLKMDPSLESLNVAIIADKQSDRSGSGKITIEQGSDFEGTGEDGSFVFLISQNNSAETGGSDVAISMSQGAAALVSYAAHGLATMNQTANVKEVTAYKISLSQSANVTYESGLPNTLFESGPGASWTFLPGSYVIQH